MKYLILAMSLFLVLGISCTSEDTASENGEENIMESTADANFDLPEAETLYQEVLDLHDEIMPKMAEVNRIGRELKALENVPEDGKADVAAAIDLLDQADSQMDGWMVKLGGFSDMNKVRAEIEEEEIIEKLKMEMERGKSIDTFIDKIVKMGKNQVKRFKKES